MAMGKQHASVSVAVIGAGKMGSALAEVLLERGIPATAWNRTPARCEPLTSLGAKVAASVADAASAADLRKL
jgi:3-hydroxyisobutyrate dehydrogenase